MEIKKSFIQINKQFNQYQLLCLAKNEPFPKGFLYLNLLFLIPEEKDPTIEANAYILLVHLLRTQSVTNHFSLFSIYKAYNYINEFNSDNHQCDFDYITFYKECAEFFNEIQMFHLSFESITKCNMLIGTKQRKTLMNMKDDKKQNEETTKLLTINDELKQLESSLNEQIKNKKEEINNNKSSIEPNNFMQYLINSNEEKNYIINCKWFKKALTYILTEQQTEYPQEINNLDLISKNSFSNTTNNSLYFPLIKKNKKECFDYTYITKSLWNKLKDIFGFSNEIITSNYIESIETQNIKILILDSTMTSRYPCFVEPLSITIPKNIKVEDFKHHIKDILNFDKDQEISIHLLSSNQKSVYKYFIFLLIYFFYSNQIPLITKYSLTTLTEFHIPSELLEQYNNENEILLSNNKLQNKYNCIIINTNPNITITPKNNTSCICGKSLTKPKLHYCIYCPEHIKKYYVYCSDKCSSQHTQDQHKRLHQWIIPYQTNNFTSKHLINDNYERCFDITKLNGIKGLKNIGLTCYFNAAFQSIIHCELLMVFLFSEMYSLKINKEYCDLINKFENVFFKLKEASPIECISPQDFVELFMSYEPKYQIYLQHDAGECLTDILNRLIVISNKSQVTKFDLSKVTNNSYYSQLNKQQFDKESNECSVIKDLFYGQKKVVLTCKEPKCNNVRHLNELFLALQLVVPKTDIIFPDKLEIICKYFKNHKQTFTDIPMKYHKNIDLKTFKDINKDLLFFCYVCNQKHFRMVKDNEQININNSNETYNEFILYEKLTNNINNNNNNSELISFMILIENSANINKNIDQLHKKTDFLYETIPNEFSCFGDFIVNKYPIIFTIHKDCSLKDFFSQLFGDLIPEEKFNSDQMNEQLKSIFIEKNKNNEPINVIIDINIFSRPNIVQLSSIKNSNILQTKNNKCDIYDCLGITLKKSVSYITCKVCKTKGKYVSIQENISFTPHYLVVLFKRFYTNQNNEFEKNNREILFTDRLNLFDYVDTQSFETDPQYFSYDLISIIFHRGSNLKGGHYITWNKLKDKWMVFDDSKVGEVKRNSFPSSSVPVILIYKRRCIQHCLG